MTSPITNTPAAASAQSNTSFSNAAAQSSINNLANPNTFLQLLVAQLANQDPQQPADGTTFVTQLATFAGVAQSAQMRSDLDAINTVMQNFAAAQAAQTAQTAQASQSAHAAQAPKASI
jgi:flagellar basal-body rod modification protein FlgD